MSGPEEEPDLGRPRRVHLVGVGGSAMAGLARVLETMGHAVSGSDQLESAAVARLRPLGIQVEIGHRADNLGGAELLAVSSAVKADNPEVVAARRRGIPVLSRSQLLTALTRLRRTLAVAGTHGKTTTSSMLAVILRQAGWDPSFVIGGDIAGIGSGADWRPGPWLVVEADESDGTFLDLRAEAVLVTSVEPDHLDHFGTFARLVESFERFVDQAPGPRVVCADGPDAAGIAARTGSATYGSAPGAEYRVEDLVLGRYDSSFRVVREQEVVAEVALGHPGAHNAANAAGAAVMAGLLGIGRADIEAGLAGFGGVGRRFERRGQRGGVTFVDDYAHNPGKVRSVLEAARAGKWSRIVCVFQPHRYTRTADLWRAYADVFDPADLVVVTEIYGAGEDPIPGVSGKLVVDALLERQPNKAVAWVPDRPELVAYLKARLRPGDLCLTLSAGDLTTLPDQLLEAEP